MIDHDLQHRAAAELKRRGRKKPTIADEAQDWKAR
jgi:hypothetical protein